MKFTPKEINEEISNGEPETLRSFLKAILILAVVIGILAVCLNEIVSLFLMRMTYQQEKKFLGETSKFYDRHTFQDDVLTRIKNDLIKNNEELKSFIEIKLLCSDDMNAYALPGGRILISSELIKLLDTENALATVIAHEIGHIYHRHHLKNISYQMSWRIILTVLSQTQSTGFVDSFVNLHSLSYSRDHESEADIFAKSKMLSEYGHLNGANQFFEELIKKDDFDLSFMSTHPGNEERLDFFTAEHDDETVSLDKESILQACL